MESPCINVCVVERGKCTACHRTVEEIASWRDMSDEERRAVMEELDERE